MIATDWQLRRELWAQLEDRIAARWWETLTEEQRCAALAKAVKRLELVNVTVADAWRAQHWRAGA